METNFETTSAPSSDTMMESITQFDYIGFANSFFSNMTFETFLKILVTYLVIVWIAIIIWVTKDITNRTNNILYQIFAIFTVIFLTPLGIIIYLLIRPSQTLVEKNYEEWFYVAEDTFDTENEEEVVEKVNCPFCGYHIHPDYKYCPHCRSQLKNECISCHKNLELDWTLCPYCGTNQKQEKVEEIAPVSQNNEAIPLWEEENVVKEPVKLQAQSTDEIVKQEVQIETK